MLDKANHKYSKIMYNLHQVTVRATDIYFRKGVAEEIPYSDNEFDKISMKFGIRNVEDRSKSLKELHRVLKTDGKISIMEFVAPKKGLLALPVSFFISHIIPMIGYITTGGKSGSEYNYLKESIFQFPSGEQFLQEMIDTGFQNCKYTNVFAWTVILFTCDGE